MTRLLRSGQVLWQFAFGFDYPSGVTPPPVIPEIPDQDLTGNIDYYRRYLLDTAISVEEVTVDSIETTHEDLDYLRRYLCDS